MRVVAGFETMIVEFVSHAVAVNSFTTIKMQQAHRYFFTVHCTSELKDRAIGSVRAASQVENAVSSGRSGALFE